MVNSDYNFKIDIKKLVSSHLNELNGYIFGYADLAGLLDNKLSKYPSGISIGKKLDDNIINEIIDGPTIEYHNIYNETNTELFMTAQKLQKDLRNNGVDSLLIPPSGFSKSLEFPLDNKKLKVILSHKMVATRAGLGWIGKTDLFISKIFGPRLRLVSLLIDFPFQIDSTPIEKSSCGNCNICVEKCPAKAANGKSWNVNVYRDEFFDAFKCRDKCKELTLKRIHKNETICGICVSVCPIGKKKVHINEESLAE